ncbi:MAG TPA: preprotein translocase subunit SecG [Candidatus Aphodousia faecipullorum]|nr:preprotein translocase subunit SecG [Candidatus Aphodousia faecipullorum]
MSSLLVSIAIVVQIVSAIAVIILVLLQHGKGADLGAAFGSGASGSLFGASGSANFLSRSTAVAATLFFLATIALTLGSGAFKKAPVPTTGVLGTVEQTQSVDADQTNTQNNTVQGSQSGAIPR